MLATTFLPLDLFLVFFYRKKHGVWAVWETAFCAVFHAVHALFVAGLGEGDGVVWTDWGEGPD